LWGKGRRRRRGRKVGAGEEGRREEKEKNEKGDREINLAR